MKLQPGRSWRRWAGAGALAATILLLPGATPAEAGHEHRRGRYEHGHGHGHARWHGHGHGHVRYGGHRHIYAPVRVTYYRPYAPPIYHVLPSAEVVVHGPGVSASVVAYPASAPVVYAPGYCPQAVHYHPYVAPAPVHRGGGVHGSVNLRFRF